MPQGDADRREDREGRRRSTNIESIVHASDAVMVARGDLGVELPFEEVPLAQKRIIRLGEPARPPGDHGDADARVDGHAPAPDARRGERRRQRDPRRHRRGDALGRDGRRAVSAARRRGDARIIPEIETHQPARRSPRAAIAARCGRSARHDGGDDRRRDRAAAVRMLGAPLRRRVHEERLHGAHRRVAAARACPILALTDQSSARTASSRWSGA